jgi:hypothetical protein
MCKGTITHQITYKREADGSRSLLRGPIHLVSSNTPVLVQDDDDVDTFNPTVTLASVLNPNPSTVALDAGDYQAHIYFDIAIPGLIPNVTDVQQFIGGSWVSLAFTKELIGLGVINDLLVVLLAIEVTDPVAETIPGVGTSVSGLLADNTVVILGVGTVSLAQIKQDNTDPNYGYMVWEGNFVGLSVPPGSPISSNIRNVTVSKRPFAGKLPLQIDYDPEAIHGGASTARLYRWFVREAGTTPWTQLGSDSRVYYRARYQDLGASIDVDVYLPYDIGLDENGFNKFRPSLAMLESEKKAEFIGRLQAWYPSSTIDPTLVTLTWPLTRLWDHASGYFPTSGISDGIYELKLCVYDETGAPLNPWNSSGPPPLTSEVTFRMPGEPVPIAGDWMIPTSPMDPVWIDNASGDPGVYFAIQVDPIPCTGTINEIQSSPPSGVFTTVGSCGLTWFDSAQTSATVEVPFTAEQVNNHAIYRMWVRRGHSTLVGTDMASLVPPSASWTDTLGDMVSDCPDGAAFAANLVVAHTATDGVHNELRWLWLWDERAFALIKDTTSSP